MLGSWFVGSAMGVVVECWALVVAGNHHHQAVEAVVVVVVVAV